jgi:hypothetical protein
MEQIDKRIRGVINQFVKGQCLQKSLIYANVKNGGLRIPCMIDEYAVYKVHHIANLMSTEERKMILNGYLNFDKKLAANQDLIGALDKALNHLKINRSKFSWAVNDKNMKPQFRFRDIRTDAIYSGYIEILHKSLANHE